MAQATAFPIETSEDQRVDILASIANFFASFNRALVAAQHAEASFYGNRWNQKTSHELRGLLNK